MRPTLARLAWYGLPLLAYAGAIFAVSAMSHPPRVPVSFRHLDKVLHLIEYAGLGVLLCRALALGGSGLAPRRAWAVAVGVGALWAASDELHQAFVPRRTPDPLDFAVDCLGLALGAGLYWALALRRAPRP